jgi:hypothetical protein
MKKQNAEDAPVGLRGAVHDREVVLHLYIHVAAHLLGQRLQDGQVAERGRLVHSTHVFGILVRPQCLGLLGRQRVRDELNHIDRLLIDCEVQNVHALVESRLKQLLIVQQSSQLVDIVLCNSDF